jgi:hypothetical protein
LADILPLPDLRQRSLFDHVIDNVGVGHQMPVGSRNAHPRPLARARPFRNRRQQAAQHFAHRRLVDGR